MSKSRSSLYYAHKLIHHMRVRLTATKNAPTLLFIHGIGDSSENYERFFQMPELRSYNLFAMDMLGYGSSQCVDPDYSFRSNRSALHAHLAQFKDIGPIVIFGHSMGADFGLFLCAENSPLQNRIVGFVNIEGSLTKDDTFISQHVAAAAEHSDFDYWFEHYRTVQVMELAAFKHSGLYRTNLNKLNSAGREAFKQNGVELYTHYEKAQHDDRCMAMGVSHMMGRAFIDLKLPKLFIYGEATHPQTQRFINIFQKQLNPVKVSSHSHWPFLDPRYAHEVDVALISFMKNIEITLAYSAVNTAQNRYSFSASLSSSRAAAIAPRKESETTEPGMIIRSYL